MSVVVRVCVVAVIVLTTGGVLAGQFVPPLAGDRTWRANAYLKASNTGVEDYFGIAVAVSGDTLVVAAPFEDSAATGVNGSQSDNSATDSGAVYVYVRSGGAWVQQAYLKASNTQAGDEFGTAVAIDGDTLVVSARTEDSGSTGANGNQSDNTVDDSGAVYVFVRSGTTWSQQAYLKASNPSINDQFGRSVDISGDTLIVGAPNEDSAGRGVGANQTDNSLVEAGAAYIFVRSGTTWSQQAYLKASNTDEGDLFGLGVAVSGDTAVVGAPLEDGSATGVGGTQGEGTQNAGAVYVFTRTAATWAEQAYVKASNTGAFDNFGGEVEIDTDTMVIAAAQERSASTGINGTQTDDSAMNAGAVYVFTRSGVLWTQQAYIKASNTDAFDTFGRSLALSGQTMVVGASAERSNATGVNGVQTDNSLFSAGAAYVFERSGTTWAQRAYLKASNTNETDVFGSAVAVGETWILVAANNEASIATGVDGNQLDNSRMGAGAAYVFEGVTPPTLLASPNALRFAGTRTSPDAPIAWDLGAATSAQRVTVGYTGSPVPQWTATSNQPWLVVTGGSGTGAGTFGVQLNTSLAPTTVGAHSAVVTLTAANAGSSATVNVTLTVQAAGTTQAPIGQVDTPTQGATGLQGAIAMTGWAVDDVGIQHVRIYRQCLAFDASGACQTVLGASVVFVGEASIIAGARPDVEALFPTYPAANTAGWGFLILSNLLPNIPASNSSGGGVGTFQLYAVATDAEGNQRLLGRSYTDVSPAPTTVTVANDTIAKPFGAIDTPGQGATVSGTLNNFGWVLTPDSNTVADGTDILVPTAGSTITVIVDGAAVGTATYNLCRGTVGNPVPSGTLCDDDVSSIFRTGTRHRNLDAGRGAIGLRTINTATLTNGLHTIQWGVTDSAGRSEGIGSRYFTVLNGAGDANGETSRWRDDEMRWYVGQAFRPAGSGRSAGLPHALRLFARTGFDLARGLTPVEAIDGVPTIRVPELGRVELQVPGVTSGALLANGELRDLPVGMAINAETGTMTWSVGPGYLGTYRLLFGVGPVGPVDIVVLPQTLEDEPVRMFVDRADVGGPALSERLVRVEGWSLDPQAETGSGIGTVHVWATRSAEVPECRGAEVPGCRSAATPVFLGVADLGVARPDVAAAHGAPFANAGWVFTGALDAGTWDVTAYVWNVRTQRFEDARTVQVVVR